MHTDTHRDVYAQIHICKNMNNVEIFEMPLKEIKLYSNRQLGKELILDN